MPPEHASRTAAVFEQLLHIDLHCLLVLEECCVRFCDII